MRPSVCSLILMLGLAAVNLAAAAEIEPPHAKNDVYQSLLRDGMTLAGTRVAFPAPLFHDGDSPAVERAALLKLAGSDDAVQELLRDSVVAPQILKIHDEKAKDGTIIRIADAWFAVHANLEAIDPAQLGGKKGEGKPVEAANMKFSSKLLGDDELKSRGIKREDPELEWYTHMTGDLLFRIHVEASDRVRATRGEGSWAFAARTDPRFDDDRQYPNRWRPTDSDASASPKGAVTSQRYYGSASTVKISRLTSVPGTLLIESHFAFAEPYAWFEGAPILRSKISVVAQDQIRRLRRELLAQRKAKPAT